MRLLIDLDGVCADFYGHLLTIYNEKCSDNLTRDDIKVWSLTPTLRKVKTKEQARDFIRKASFWSEMPMIDGAAETLFRLQSAGHDIIILSATPKDATVAGTEKLNWVHKHLPFIPHNNIFLGCRKDLVRGDMLFDDGPHNLVDYPDKTCVMDAAYNRDVKANYRVSNWQEFEKVVNGL